MANSTNNSTNSMGFKNEQSAIINLSEKTMSMKVLQNYEIKSLHLNQSYNSYSTNRSTDLGIRALYNNTSKKINSIMFSCVLDNSSKMQFISLYLNNVSTTYTLNKLHIVSEYPYITSNSADSQPTTYALVIDLSSYNNPVKDKLYIYLPFTSEGTGTSANSKILSKTLKYIVTDITNNQAILNDESTKPVDEQIYLNSEIPTNYNYYCQSFKDSNNANITNIFFDRTYNIYLSNSHYTSLTGYLNQKTSYLDYSNLKNTILSDTSPYLYKSEKYVISVAEIYERNTDDIYIDCSPTDMNDEPDKNPFLQINSSIKEGSNNLMVALSYIIFVMFIGLLVYGIFKIPSLFKSSSSKNMEDVTKLSDKIEKVL